MNYKLLAFIAIIASTVGLSTSVLTSGSQALALSGSNDKCITTWDKDDFGAVVTSTCGLDADAFHQSIEQCKQSDAGGKCSGSQTGQGVFPNNPDKPKPDNGEGIFEKYK